MYVFFIDFKTQFIHGKQRILMTMQGWETLTGTKTENDSLGCHFPP